MAVRGVSAARRAGSFGSTSSGSKSDSGAVVAGLGLETPRDVRRTWSGGQGGCWVILTGESEVSTRKAVGQQTGSHGSDAKPRATARS